jgi:peptide/nickel transport system substrate-binding protein
MRKFICYVVILSVILLSGCVKKDVPVEQNNNVKDSIIYNIEKMPKDLVMLNQYNPRQQDLLVNLFEGLVTMDDKGKILPGLSESWSISKDETTYTFKIRENAKWSDGSDITSKDFVNFFSQILNKDTKNVYANDLYYIFGAEDYRKGNIPFNKVAIRAVNSKSLEIRLNYPCNYFLNILSEPIYSLRKIDGNLTNWMSKYKDIEYTGGFKIDKISQDGNITLKKNGNYWNSKAIKTSKITITSINESEAALAAFQDYKIDLFVKPPTSEVKRLVTSDQAIEMPLREGSALVFNMQKEGIIKNINIRNAIALDIDRSKIVKEILKDTAKSALSYIPPNTSNGIGGQYINKNFFTDTSQKEKALALIKNNKIQENLQPLKLIYLESVENKKVSESIAKSLKDELNINVQCEGYEANKFDNEIKSGNYDIANVKYDGNYDYPLAFLENWVSNSSFNLYGYRNTKFDILVEKSKLEKDENKKLEYLKQAEDILIGDMAIVPLYFHNMIICKKDNIKDIYVTKQGNIKFDKVYISPKK